jgi:hypothetical protein
MVQIKGRSASGAGSVVTRTQLAVYTGATWGSWTRRPYLEALQFATGAAPSIGQGTFRYHWGTIKREDKTSFSTEPFLDLRGHFVKVEALNTWGGGAWWYGIIDADQPLPHGGDVGGGVLTLNAYELAHLLDREVILTAPALDGNDALIEIENVPTANERYERGRAQLGNRSAAKQGEIYVFGGTDKWTNLQLAEMLLSRYTPQGVTFVLGGQKELLEQITSVTDLYGLSPWAVVNRLVNRNRGLGLATWVSDGKVLLYVYSVLSQDVKVGEVTIKANPYPVNLDTLSNIFVAQPKIVRSQVDRYDEVEVRGARLLSCFTVCYYDETLEEAWSAGVDSLEEAYLYAAADAEGYGGMTDPEKKALNDAYRDSDRFDTVFVKHRIPKTWDGMAGVAPALLVCRDNGTVEWDETTPFYPQGKAFEDFIPLEECGDYGVDPPTFDLRADNAQPVYRRPFALVYTEEEQYEYVERPSTRAYAANFSIDPRELAVRIEASVRHLYGLNVFDSGEGGNAEPTNTQPELDYASLYVTVALRMDGHLRYVAAAKNANSDKTKRRRKALMLEDAEYWAVASKTYVDVNENMGVVVTPNALVLRDDSARIRQAAALALAWYGEERAVVSVTIRDLQYPCVVGQLLKTVGSTAGDIRANTPVTSIAWDAQAGTVTIQTSWYELDISREF